MKSPYFQLHTSDIFEDNFDVESVATVKGLKLVTDGEFGGVSLHKITSANENDIDTLTSISTTTRDIFHTAVQEGKTIYTPSAPVTYGEWQGLFYISIDFDAGLAGYIIGEGLNGGYTACGLPGAGGTICNWSQDFFDLLVPQAYASGITAQISANPVSVFIGEAVNIAIEYTKGAISWIVNFIFRPSQPGQVVITPQYDDSSNTTIDVSSVVLGNPNNPDVPIDTKYDDLFLEYAYSSTSPQFDIPADLIKTIASKESGHHFNLEAYRYEPCYDAGAGIRDNPFHDFENDYPWTNYWIDQVGANREVHGNSQVGGKWGQSRLIHDILSPCPASLALTSLTTYTTSLIVQAAG